MAVRLTRNWQETLILVLLLVALLACVAAVVTWAALQLLTQVPAWAKVVSAALAAMVSVVGGALVAMSRERFGRRPQTQRELARLFRFWDKRRGPRVRDVTDPCDLGVHEAPAAGRDEPAGTSSPPPYVGRTRDDELDKALRTKSLVLLVGASTAGKSRSAFEAMQRLFPNRLLLVPTGKGSLPSLEKLGVRLPDSVIWLDELDRYLGEDGLTTDLLERLTEQTEVVILATMRATTWEEYTSPSEVRRAERDLLRRAHRIRLERNLDDQERVRAEEQAQDRRIAAALSRLHRYGLAEYLAAGPALLDRLLNACDDVQPVGFAIVRAAVDWQRAGLQRSVLSKHLEQLYPTYLNNRQPAHLRSDAFRSGLEWASKRLYGSAALLLEERDGYRAFDYLVDHYAEQAAEHPVAEQTWQFLLATVTDPEEETMAGTAAYFSGRRDFAEVWWRRAAEAGHAMAAYSLGVLFQEQGKLGEAKTWYRRAAEAGEAMAAYNLGWLFRKQGKPEEAEAWYRRAAEAGEAMAAYNLGWLFEEQGKLDEAEAWYRRAAEAGEAMAAYNLGWLFEEQGKLGEAEAWYRRAAEAGEARAATNLGLLFRKQGKLGEAETWYRRAVEAGEARAATNLGLLFQEQGKLGEAEAWYRRAVEAGHPPAAYNLGRLLKEREKLEEAETKKEPGAEG